MRGYIEDEFSKRYVYVRVDIDTGKPVEEMEYLMTIGEAGSSNYAVAMNRGTTKLVLKSEA